MAMANAIIGDHFDIPLKMILNNPKMHGLNLLNFRMYKAKKYRLFNIQKLYDPYYFVIQRSNRLMIKF